MDEEYNRHDDCSFGDNGLTSDSVDASGTIQWHASLDIDNVWGGGNFENPETIGLGPIDDKDGDGKPDVDVIDDQYLVVVGYVNCLSKFNDGFDRCDPNYTGEDGAHEIEAKVDILLDGDYAPRKAGSDRPADSYGTEENGKMNTKFKIKLYEWKVLAVVKWDNSLKGPDSNPAWKGNAIVSDTKMESEGITIDPVNHPVCAYDNSDAVLVPIWDADAYVNFVTNPNELDVIIGECH